MSTRSARFHGRARRRAGVLLTAAGLLTGLLVALAGHASADPTPPPNPSDAQIGAAQAGKAQLAAQVGDLTAQLTQLQGEVEQLQAGVELAEQKYAYAASLLDDAKAAAVAAKQDVADAAAAVDDARSKFNASVRANYQQATVQGGPGALLASDDPDELLQSAALQAYVTEHQVDGIGQLGRAQVAKANADARARTAVATETQRTAEAEQAYSDAQAAHAAAEQRTAQVAVQQASVQTQLDTAQSTLLGLQNQRAAYEAWKAEQARIAAEREAQRQAQILAQQQAAAAALAAQQPKGNSGSSGNSGNSGGSGGSGSSGNPSGGSWSAAKGQAAVDRAMAYKGARYSFAAGNYNGPTYGRCGSDDAGWNDCHVFGFDCSGLTLYAWAPSIHLDHYSVTQYTQAGSYHPGTGDLMPGDLVFWSDSTGQLSHVHHVALYIGGGNVLQAPNSGDVVKITNLWSVAPHYFGATRPLT